MNNLIVFTDGSFRKKYNYCGYGVHFPNKEMKSYGNIFKLENPTNQRAELYAIYSALKRCIIILKTKQYKEINIYSDSKYSIECLTVWCNKWKKNNWKTKDNKDVSNQDLIKKNLKLMNKINIKICFFHVNSHTGKKDYNSINNDIVDKLANLKFFKNLKENQKSKC